VRKRGYANDVQREWLNFSEGINMLKAFVTQTLQSLSVSSNVFVLFCEAFSAKTHVNQARHGRDELLLFRFAGFLRRIEFSGGAVVNVWAVSCHHRRFPAEKKLSWWHAGCTEPCTNLEAIIIRRVSIEISAFAILPRLCVHRDSDVDVMPCIGLHPSIHLDQYSFWGAVVDFDVHDVQGFSASAFLQVLPYVIVIYMHDICD